MLKWEDSGDKYSQNQQLLQLLFLLKFISVTTSLNSASVFYDII